jgi:hypothetical protein
MSIEVHIDWKGQTCFVGRLHAAERASSVSFEYATEWLQRPAESRLGGRPCARERFGVNIAEAKRIPGEVFAPISNWRKAARELRMTATTMDAYASAFESPIIEEARHLLRL